MSSTPGHPVCPAAPAAPRRSAWVPALAAAALAAGLLAAARAKAPYAVLLADRFLPGSGWAEVALLSGYAGWLVPRLLDPALAKVWRPRLWHLFSAVFFGQLALGLLGFERFLMTGRLHLPVPALILAGPLYRGSGYFMLVLFLSTVVLVGPAWCSHLCYIGAWDDAASRRRRPMALPGYARAVRWAILALVVLAALLLRALGAPVSTAAILAAVFGLTGIAAMLLLSRRQGQMVHCTAFCPIGLLANLLGRLNPFRVRFGSGCTECRACTFACRYNALNLEDIQRRRPGLNCTLCGDCLSRCRHGQLFYAFPGLNPQAARVLFVVLVVALHAAFLGLARI